MAGGTPYGHQSRAARVRPIKVDPVMRDGTSEAASPRARRRTAAWRSLAVVTPLAAGLAFRHQDVGLAGAFGAYLVLASFSSLDTRPAGPVVLFAVVCLGTAATAGAAAAPVPAALTAGTAVVAAAQALGEIAGGPLRMTAAMSALAFLLAGANLAADTSWWLYAASFVLGTWWQSMVLLVSGPPSGPALGECLTALRRRARGATRYAATLVALGTAGAATASALPLGHAQWLTTTALRVAKPDTALLVGRARARIAGTLGGGGAAALLLMPRLPSVVLVTVVAVVVFAMQLVGGARYGWWSLCLTVVALVFTMEHGTADRRLTVERMVLTVAGAALALVTCALAARCGPHRRVS